MGRVIFFALTALAVVLVALGLGSAADVADANLADFVEWDLSNWSPALDFWLQSTSLDLSGSVALELGAGLGGLSLWLALRGARVVCSDLKGATDEARALHRKYNVQHLITYRAVDATSIPYAGHFDLVLFKSVLGDVGRGGRRELQARAVGEIYKSLRPGGELWFAENLTGSALHRLARRFIRRGSLWRYVSLDEMKELLSPFGRHACRTTGFLGVFGRGGVPRKLLGALDHALFNHVVPERWRYVVIGTAKK
ncbi:MAG TPA: methyltransferase domain-containing protein [Pyrinomonadaceae bacterium]|jgi:SAM-dependent methyltransferase